MEVCVLGGKASGIWEPGPAERLWSVPLGRLAPLLPEASLEPGLGPSVTSLGEEEEAIGGCYCLSVVLSQGCWLPAWLCLHQRDRTACVLPASASGPYSGEALPGSFALTGDGGCSGVPGECHTSGVKQGHGCP